jgi:DNA-binding IclR family transcriptional regulator
MKNKATSARPAAPALARGIRILRLLEQRSCSLDAIAREVKMPKSSILRMLDTLIGLGLVARDERTGSYAPLTMLVPVAAGAEKAWQQRLENTLTMLAESTGATAEWYVPGPQGMVLLQQAEPPQGEVRVRARAGFIRTFDGELDAVACLGHAWFTVKEASSGSFWTYDRQGRHRNLGQADVARRIALARECGSALDEHFNTNGVRRLACLIRRGNRPLGVLALAESLRPNSTPRPDQLLLPLQTAVEKLSE